MKKQRYCYKYLNKYMKPIQLISFDANKKIQVNEEAIKWLKGVSQEHHLGVITVVGKYRTGKSYILNRVLLNQNMGFEVGPTINACTKGLWVWPELIENPNDIGTKYMVMDTEGLGSLEEGQQTDTKIFLMAMLLSSFFIYNSMGSIDEKAVQSLSLIINLSKLLQKGQNRDRQNIIQCFPSFLWLVRDFSLRLVDSNNYPISPKDYLENALQLQNGTSDMVKRKNSIRKELISFFKDRDCFTLIRPVDDQSKLQNMAKVREDDLRPKFKELVQELRRKVFYQAKAKLFKGKPCSPAMFIELCQHFCDSINKGGLPEIESNWDLVCKAEVARVEKRCYGEFDKVLDFYSKKKTKQINMKEFEKETYSKIEQVLKYFQKNALGQKVQKKKMMKEKMESELESLKKKMSREKNQEMQSCFDEITNKIQDKINSNSIEDVFAIIDEYDQVLDREEKSSTVQSLAFIYQKSYEGLKSSVSSYISNAIQSEKYQKNILSEKLNLYQTSFDRVQNEYSKKTVEAEERERELRQKLYSLELQAQQTQIQLTKTRSQLESLQH